MGKVKVITDSNSGITQEQAEELGVVVLPMPFFINEKQYFEGISMSQDDFYRALLDSSAEVSTSQPSPEAVMDLWRKELAENEEIVHIPMSSGISSSCATALMLADEDELRDGYLSSIISAFRSRSGVRSSRRRNWRTEVFRGSRYRKSFCGTSLRAVFISWSIR